MNCVYGEKTPFQPFQYASDVFDSRPVATHGQEVDPPARIERKEQVPNKFSAAVVEGYPIGLGFRLGYEENRRPVFNYPGITGAKMPPVPLSMMNHIPIVRGAPTFEIDFEQQSDRIVGAPPMKWNRQWDQSYPRYFY